MSKKKVQEFYSAIDEIVDKEAFLESVREGFLEIEDPRTKDNQSYRLVDLLIIILCAVLAGANTITDIHAYSQVKIRMFQQLLQMSTSPSYNVYTNKLKIWFLAAPDIRIFRAACIAQLT